MNKERDEKLLKSWLKKKITITTATVVAFLITGLIISTPIYASVLIGATENDNLTVTKTNNQGSKVDNSGITIGGAISKAGNNSVHIGDYSGSMGTRNVVIGTNASAGYDAKRPDDNPPKDDTFNQSVAIGAGSTAGEGARAYGDQSIAIGSNTIARGNSSIAIGNDDVDKTGSTNTTYTDLNGKTKTGSIANAYAELTGENLGVGQYQDTTSKEAAVAIGVKSVAGDISLALGTGARAEKVNAVAIGTGATANRDNAIAIGGGSTTDKAATQELSTTVNGLTFKWSGGDRTLAGDVVSFGKAGYERQLKHVSPGKVSEDSTDAINGSQLHGVLSHLTEDPVFMFAADDSDKSNVVGDTPTKKQEDGKIKKIVARSISDSRLNILGGAEGNNLSDKNISVRYEDEKTLKIKLAKNLTELESAEFKNTGGDKTTINGDGVTITPVANGKKPVSVTKNGLNNGGNVIANVAGNLEGAKPNSTEPTTNATVPTDVDSIKNNAATVGDVLNAGWNLQNNGKAKDFVKPYDTVNFADGNGTTAVVDTEADSSTSKIKYNVNLGNGLQKDAATNKITVKTADESLTVDADGLKAKTDGKTITTGDSGLKVVTGKIESGTTPGTMKVKDGDAGKIATVDSVVKAVNSAAFTLKASSTTGGTRNGSSTVEANGEAIKAGSTIEMIAGKNLDVKHDENGKITFATVENPSFKTVQVGGDQGPKFSKTSDGNIKVSDKDGENPVKITNVKDGAVNENSKDAINGSQFHKLANNTIKLAGQNGSNAATETGAQNLNQQDGIKFTVKSSDGKLLEVTAGGDTITLTPKTGTITTTNGVPTANTTNGKLVTADQIVNALTEMGWKATADKDGTGTVTGTTSELIKAGETVTFKAGNNLIIKQSGKEFAYSLNPELTDLSKVEVKDKAGNSVVTTPTGTTITAKDATDPTKDITTVINAGGTTVTDKDGNTTKVDGNGLTITPKDTTKKPVSVTKDGINAGDKAITNVASNLTNYNSGNKNELVDLSNTTTTPNSNVATVGDLRNMGWVVSSDKTTENLGTAYNDKVKNADEVKFVGTGVATVSGKTGADGVRTITVDVTVPSVEKGSINAVTVGGDKGKVVANTRDGDKFTTVDTVVNAINSAAWKATSGTEGTGAAATGHTESVEEIKAGDTVTFKAGDNLVIKQAGKDFTYSLAKELKDLSKVEVKDGNNVVTTTPTGTTTTDGTNTTTVGPTGTTTKDKDGNKTEITKDGVKITPVKDDTANPGTKIPDTDKAVSLTKDGLNNGGNTISNVAGNLPKTHSDTKDLDGTTVVTPTPSQAKPDNIKNIVNNAATVGDVLNAGWNLQNNGDARDFVKPYDTVNFVDGENTKVVVETDKDGKVSTIKVNTDTKKITDNVPFEYTVKDPTDGTRKTVVKATDGKFYEPADVNPDGTVKSGRSPVLDPAANPNNKELEIKAKDKAPITNVDSGLKNYTDAPKAGLRDLSNTTATPDSNVATVGDLRNMGWVVSSDKTTDNLGTAYSEAVKNANEVKFVGTGLATVSGKTNNDIRTITVDVDYNKVTESTPFEYGIKNPTTGNVTPVVKATDGKYYDKNDLNSDGTPKTGVTPKLDPTNANDPNKDNLVIKAKGTDPQTVNNVKGSLDQTVNTGDKVQDTNGKLGTTTATTPTTEKSAPTNVDKIYNNAATVGDVLNAGWNLQNNGDARDFVKPYDTVNFVDGENTKVVVETDKDGKSSTIKVDVKDNLKNITSISNEGANDKDGNPITAANATKITLGKDADGNKTVDVGGAKITNVADGEVTDTSKDAVNGSQLKAVKDEAEKHTTLSVNGGDKDKAGNNSPAGNLVIKETVNDKGGKHYDVKLADKVTLGTDDTKAVTVDGTTGKITAGKGENGVGIDGTKAEIKAGDGANAVTINGKDGKVTVGDNITLNNADKSATIGDVKVNGKDGHITGLKNKDWTIGTTQPVSGRAATEDQLKKLEDGIVDKIDNLGWEATVGKEGTGKSEPDAKNNKETVRVDHTTNVHYQAGDNLIVKEEIIRAKDAAGKDTDKVSDAKYTYRLNDEITLHNVTVKPKDGKDGAFTVQNADGKDAVSIKPDADGAGAISVNGKDGKPAVAIGKDGVAVKGEDGKPDAATLGKDADGNGTVAVKGADGKSGVSLNGKDGSIGINGKDGSSVSMTTEKGPKGLDEENEKPRMTYEFTKINPDGTPVLDPTTNKPVTVKENLATMNDGLHFAGDNNATTISKKLNEKLEIVGGADRDKLTKNNIGVNANAEGKLEVQLSKELKGMTSAEFTDPNTGNIVKITGEGTTITNPKTGDTVIMNQGGITISKTDKDGKPNNVSLTREGLNNGGNNITNVKSNLPQVNDGAKKAYDANGNPIANKNNIAAPITAADAADIVKKAGNNAATASDVLNAGWNLQENGSDRDFVKPYDTVNFVDGTNTKVTVKTNEDGTKSNVQINLVGLPIAFADKDGNRVVQGVKDGKIVYHKMLSDGTASKELVDPKNVQVTNVNPTDAKINTVGTPGATINNVAPAEVSPTSTQAVNGSQLYQVAQEINNVNNKVDKLGDRVNKGLAGAAAMSGIEFMEIGINQATVAAAVGGYRGTHAVAVGVQAAPTENTRVNAKMSLTPGSRTEAMYSVGAAYRFNLK